MSLAELIAVIIFVGLTFYVVFGGADFGSGIWDVLSRNDNNESLTRNITDRAIGPVWEANHVWLIFVLVFLWGGFPTVFAALMTSVAIPLWIGLFGIVMRGAGFSFRKYAPSTRAERWFQNAFGYSSIITPFFFGTVVGAVASGRVPADGGANQITSWVNPTSLYTGVAAVVLLSYLGGSLLISEASELGLDEEAARLGAKNKIIGYVAEAVAWVGLPILLSDAPTVSHNLVRRGLPFLVLFFGLGAWSLVLLHKGNYKMTRPASALALTSLLVAWGVSQFPWMLTDQVKINDAAGSHASLVGLLVSFVLAGIFVLPPLFYLLRWTQNDVLLDD